MSKDFSAEFPVKSEVNSNDFIGAFRKWILGSRHTKLSEASLNNIDKGDPISVNQNEEKITLLKSIGSAEEAVAIRYDKEDSEGFKWTTELVFSQRRHDSWVSVRTSCRADRAAVKLPAPRKPIIVRQLLDGLGGGRGWSVDCSGDTSLS